MNWADRGELQPKLQPWEFVIMLLQAGDASPRVELSTADLPIEATQPARHCLVSLGRLQRAQAVGPD